MAAPTTVDVLIIGAGPAGLALANWFRNSDISILLIDKKPGPTPRGQAEGLKSTTVEIFESFGIGPQIAAESWRLEEIAIWGPKKHAGGKTESSGIVRERVMQDKVEELGKARETMLQQSRVEHHMLQNLLSSGNITIQRNTTPVSLSIDTCAHRDAHAVIINLETTKEDETHAPTVNGDSEVNEHSKANGHSRKNEHTAAREVRAKYVVGCDGAHSWLRKQLDISLEGDLTDSVFGVMDIVPKSNFPDIRRVCYLRAATGTILLVPRSNKEVRLYIPVESGSTLSDPKDLTFERILSAARKIIAPYTLEVGSVSWWSAYRVGQRVGTQFSKHNRAFLAGDAIHTHSPKAGQGMNISIQDAYNLGWKLRLVLRGGADPDLLATYESERRPVAQDLIAFDRGYLKLFTAPSTTFDNEFLRAMKFTTGLSIRYPPSAAVRLSAGPDGTTTAPGPSLLRADLVPGKRLPDFQAVYQADGTTIRIHPRLHASGAFRLLALPGDIARAPLYARLAHLGTFLAAPAPGLQRLTAEPAPRLEVLVVHCAARDAVELLALPPVFRPWSEAEGFDYWRVLADAESAHEGHGRVYERLAVDPGQGCTVVVRPDGYVGAVLEVDDEEGLGAYFEGLGM